MIIKHIDGSEVDTDKLPDIDAQIFEKIEELRVLCETSNRICLAEPIILLIFYLLNNFVIKSIHTEL